jgi:Integrase core domain
MLAALEPAEPVRRYEREHPGELIHIDIKKLVKFNAVGHRITGDRRGKGHDRGIGWEFVHVCIDDASRIAFVQVMPDDTKQSAVAFLNAAVAYYESLGVKVARVMPTTAVATEPWPFAMPAAPSSCVTSAPDHIRLAPMERPSFIQTALREWPTPKHPSADSASLRTTC